MSTRPFAAFKSSLSATDTLAVESMITLPPSDFSERSLSTPSIVTVPVSLTFPRLEDTEQLPFLSRKSSTVTPAAPTSVAEPVPEFDRFTMSRASAALRLMAPEAVAAERTTRLSESEIEIPVPAEARTSSALELRTIDPPAMRSSVVATSLAWLAILVFALTAMLPSAADTTAAEETVTAPVRLVI